MEEAGLDWDAAAGTVMPLLYDTEPEDAKDVAAPSSLLGSLATLPPAASPPRTSCCLFLTISSLSFFNSSFIFFFSCLSLFSTSFFSILLLSILSHLPPAEATVLLIPFPAEIALDPTPISALRCSAGSVTALAILFCDISTN